MLSSNVMYLYFVLFHVSLCAYKKSMLACEIVRIRERKPEEAERKKCNGNGLTKVGESLFIWRFSFEYV